MTPMMQQYFEVKRGLPRDTLLLFRLGDFFELFFDDAVVASKLLGLTLTKRIDHPMAGIPAHALDTYVNKLLAHGRKVAICDQAEPAKPGKLVKRSLSRILTPGTTLSPTQLDAQRNHYVAALRLDKRGLHASWMDLSTGEFQLASDPRAENLLPVLTALAPAEVVLTEGDIERWRTTTHHDAAAHALLAFCSTRPCSELPAFQFEPSSAVPAILSAFRVLNLDGFGIAAGHPAIGPAGALVQYVTDNLCARPENLRTIQEYRSEQTLLLDPATLRNLEIFQSSRGTRDGSLLHAINRTGTAPGARLLERWLASPPLNLAELQRRQGMVAEFQGRPASLGALREQLAQVRDVPRILGRLQNRLRNPRELLGIRETLMQLPAVRNSLSEFGGVVAGLANGIPEFASLRELLAASLADDMPADISEGGCIRGGYDAELDRLHTLTSGNKTWLSDLESAEQERTGIRSLKVRFNSVFGYYIEVTKANLHLVPADYVRKQTTANGERYITEALKQKEKEIFHAEENALNREKEIFATLVAAVLDESVALTQTADQLAEIDVLAGWSLLAREWNYCRPELDKGTHLEISDGRHPVVEQMLKDPANAFISSGTAFVPNDTMLSSDEVQIALITGPNMAGKSTYIRQVALITLLAQIGCWVPATRCRIGLVDRIFSRVGASDDLARGNSTFMVEMNETANILNNASDRSLIILDEIGRGTSTYDGLSIAWAVVEHLHNGETQGPRTLFATHYQELTQLSRSLSRLKNFSVAVKEWNDDIVFVRRVVEGAADRSYGIQVARLAGLPVSVIDRAKSILAKLESDDATVELPAAAPKARPRKKITVSLEDDHQLSLL